ncbi:GIY-YIG nuclease family protein [Nonomuraea sp. NPDC050404]|uniref:GIY-YIG nuclease family protein n=1 Tax=Nonomuraea sp. NPDC050404 TaxID=3155783 RepID=UPI0033E8B1DC
MGDSSAYDDTLFHLDLIRRKLEKLQAAQLDAERQVLHRIGRDYVAGLLTEDDLHGLCQRYRETVVHLKRPGWSKLWDEAVPFKSSTLTNFWVIRRYRQNEDGAWSGEGHLDQRAPRPRDGQAVVYVLFDDENVPCYVGSTEKFKQRIGTHRRDDGKSFVRWIAYPCPDREAAYVLEDRLLKEHKPYLNRRAAR